MKYRVILFFLVVIMTACGTQKKISRQYNGKPAVVLNEAFGEPKSVIESADGQVFIYEKEEDLQSTEISQGKLTLDPIVTPKVKKTTRYYFTVKNEKIVSSKLEEEYKR